MASAAWARARSWGAFCPRTSANKCQYLTETVRSGEPFCSYARLRRRERVKVVGQFRRGPEDTLTTFTFTLNRQPGKTHTHLLLTRSPLIRHCAHGLPPALITPKLTPPSRRVGEYGSAAPVQHKYKRTRSPVMLSTTVQDHMLRMGRARRGTFRVPFHGVHLSRVR